MKHPISFFQDISIPFHLCDPAGIVFFGNVFSLAHHVYEKFVIHQLGYKWGDWFKNPDWFIPIKHASADYKIPLHAGEIYRVEVSITMIKTSSFSIQYRFLKEEHEHCAVDIVHVFCNRASMKKMEIPEGVRSRLELC